MKKSARLFWILLIVGFVGLAATVGIVVGTGTLYSRETAKSYAFDETPSAVTLETAQAQVSLVPADECRVEAYVKAWRTDKIDMDDVLDIRMEDGKLAITETPFPDDFFGFFPQPYELKLTIYAPQAVCDALEGDTQ